MNYLVTGTARYRTKSPEVFTIVLHFCSSPREAAHRSEMHVRVVGGSVEGVDNWSVTSAVPFDHGEDVAVSHGPAEVRSYPVLEDAGSVLPRGYAFYAMGRYPLPHS